MTEEKDKLIATEGLQEEEITRLLEAEEGKGDIKNLSEAQMIMVLKAKIGHIELQVADLKSEKERLEKEIVQ